jgi:hypothetical protein
MRFAAGLAVRQVPSAWAVRQGASAWAVRQAAVRLGHPPGGHPLGPSAWAVRRRSADSDVHRDAPRRHPSDVIFLKDVRCDNPVPACRLHVNKLTGSDPEDGGGQISGRGFKET